jgi:hypothetical protein
MTIMLRSLGRRTTDAGFEHGLRIIIAGLRDSRPGR